MPTLQLPQTAGCLVCGPSNPHGLHLALSVETETGLILLPFTPQPYHIGFQGIIHGGLIATILDEAMVWAASWNAKSFCLCGEITVRFRASAAAGTPLSCRANVESSRPRLITAAARLTDDSGKLIATATGKYVPLSPSENQAFVATFIPNSATATAAEIMRAAR